MHTRITRDRSYRRVVAGGLAVSFVAHVAILAFGRVGLDQPTQTDRAVRLVVLADPIERPAPSEVVRLIDLPSVDVASGDAPPAAEIPRRVSAPSLAGMRASLRAAVPDPLALLKKLEESEEPLNPVATYASITHFRPDASDNPKELRSLDGRSVDVLAALAAAHDDGSGAYVGGGHCPAPGGLF